MEAIIMQHPAASLPWRSGNGAEWGWETEEVRSMKRDVRSIFTVPRYL